MSKITKMSITALHLGRSIDIECSDVAVTNNFSPEWASEQTYGKMDPVATFSHVGREASYEIVMLAKTIHEAAEMQRNIDQLIKFQYPKYMSAGAAGSVLSAPPFFKVTFMQNRLYNAVEGYFTAFQVNGGHAEDVVPLVGGSPTFFYERKWTINFTMTVLHTGVVGHLGGHEPGGTEGFVFNNDSLGAVPPANSITMEDFKNFGLGVVDTFNSAVDAITGGGDD